LDTEIAALRREKQDALRQSKVSSLLHKGEGIHGGLERKQEFALKSPHEGA
jgi:hypothetical protein